MTFTPNEYNTIFTYDELNDVLIDECIRNYVDFYIAEMKVDNDIIYEPFCIENGHIIVWFNDWYEGQKNIKLLGVVDSNSISNFVAHKTHQNRYNGGWNY